MEALGLFFVGTTLLLLIGHVAEVFGRQWSAGGNSPRWHTLFHYAPARRQRADSAPIDPVLEIVRRDRRRLGELGLELRYVLEAHLHVDQTPVPWLRAHETQASVVRLKNAPGME
jgi:hypothetical protein